MARSTFTLTWGGNANSGALAAGSTATSDAQSITAGIAEQSIQVSATISAAPASGDVLDCYLELSSDGTTFDSTQEAQLYPLGSIDFYSNDTATGSPPAAAFTAVKTFGPLLVSPAAFKLHVKLRGSNSVSSVSAVYVEVS